MDKTDSAMHVSVAPRKSHAFLIFMLIYILLFIVAGFFALRYLSGYLEEYESSRPKHVVEQYLQVLNSGNIPDDPFPVLYKIDPEVQSREDSLRFINEKLSEAKLYRAIDQCSDTCEVYYIKNGSDVIGRAEMTPSGTTEHGFQLWDFSKTEFDFDTYLNSSSIIIPSEYRVEVNGKTLSRSKITDSKIRYDVLSSFYDSYPGLPTLVKYETGSMLGDIEFSVYNAGNRLMEPDELNEALYLNSVFPAPNKNDIIDYTEEFVRKYADYTSNAGGYTTMLYSQLKEIVIPESDLHNRIRLAFDAMNYINCKSCEVSDLKNVIVSELTDGVYYSNVEYTSTVKGNSELKSSESNIGLIIVKDTKGMLKAESMVTY
ncbi:MAG: hypothetical protein Q4F31_08035 [Eubacteriales bacterium]|nr:hypothetical protein [Eubacteriales bacterium]